MDNADSTVNALDSGSTAITDTFVVTSADGGTTMTVTVTISGANDAPTITSTAVTAATEDAAYTYTVTAADVDSGDTVTLTGTTVPSWATFTAGTGVRAKIHEMTDEEWHHVVNVNLNGMYHGVRAALPHFLETGKGNIIATASSFGVLASPRYPAYSATKAAAHQLARIASLELAEIDVRVNMVSPDAVFSEGKRKSGLWAAVGPDRMQARGLNEKELEEYYRNRNLLKVKITASHVAHAALFFCTRQTPTTGATLPVDGGLPDATPR